MTEDKFLSLSEVDTDYSEKSHELVTEWAEHYSELFLKSPSAKFLSLSEKDNVYFIISSLAELAYSYHLQKPKQWNTIMLTDVCTEIMPRKISAEPGFFKDIVPVLTSFFAWGENNGYLLKTNPLRKRLKKIKDDIIANASNPECWGMTKSLFGGALDAGIDVENKDELTSFLNEKLKDKLH